MKNSYLWTLVMWLAGFSVAFAQYKPLHFEYLTVNNGLPHNSVFCQLQDKNGLLWLGTQDGLVRYDGYVCRVVKQMTDADPAFQGKSVHALMQDSKGHIWAGTQSGLNRLDARTGQWSTLNVVDAFAPIAQKWVRALYEDAQGRIWVGTLGAGFMIYNPKTQSAQVFNHQNSLLTNDFVSHFAADATGRIWIGTSGQGLFYFDENTQNVAVFHSTLPNDTDFSSFRKTFFSDNKGAFWVGTEGSGLYRLDPRSWELARFTLAQGLSSNNVMSIAQDRAGLLLLATDGGGLNVLDPASGGVVVYGYGADKGSLNSNALYHVLIDQDENVWIGSYNGGVNIYKKHKTRFKRFEVTGARSGELSHRSVLSLCPTAGGQVLLGTDGGGLNVFDPVTNRFSRIENRPKGYGNVVKTIFEDSQKRIWLGYYNDGLSLYEPKNKSFQHFRHQDNAPHTLSGNNVWSMAEDQQGQLWLAVLGNGLNLFDPQSKRVVAAYTHQANNPLSIGSNDVVGVYVDAQNRLWVATADRGLDLFDVATQRFQHFRHDFNQASSLSADDVRCVFSDSKGRLWVGTESGGLNLWLGEGRFRAFTTANGLSSNAIMSISEDKSGYIWLSTFNGVTRLTFGADGQPLVSNFDFHKMGEWESNQFNQLAVTAVGASVETETLWFGGINGLHLVRPSEVVLYDKKPQVVITDFKIFDRSVSPGSSVLAVAIEQAKQVSLSYADKAFSIEFAALDYTAPFKNQYAYKMEGFDKAWRYTTGEQREANYTNLDPGTYTFRVKGTNNNGVWSDEKVLIVTVMPPFWQTWWFKCLLTVLALALTALALAVYTKRREMALKQQVLESEKAILALTNEKLASEVQAKNRELLSEVVQTAHKNEILIAIKTQLEAIKTASDVEKMQLLRGLTSQINTEIQGEQSWTQFLQYFDSVNPDFTSQLVRKHPTLTQNDLRMCALTRLNMSNKEMAALLNISVNGIEKSRYRLKKRLNLTAEDDLSAYLRQF